MKETPETLAVVLDGKPLSLSGIAEMLGKSLDLQIAADVWSRIDRSAKLVGRLCNGDEPAYGINTGFGKLCRKRIPHSQLSKLQENLVLSHAVGVGGRADNDIVRLMLLFKIHALSHGVSGISRKPIELMAALLRADLLPVVPLQGSLGASGDLAPLAHMTLPLIGRGQVVEAGRVVPASEALGRAALSPIQLGPKEGLALVNGTQFMSAHAAIAIAKTRRLIQQADIFASMSLEAIKGSLGPFEDRLHQLRPHPGAIASAANVRDLVADSEIYRSHAGCDRVQDPYSIRCVPQVHGASRDALAHASEVIEREINSVTDNPIIFEDGDVVSGGLFHGQPIALVMDYLAIALSELASISERRIYLLLSGVDGLPEWLMEETGINSGFMIPQYTAAALVSENKGLCSPASVDTIPSSQGQEDHVSMGARAAVKCLTVLANTETVLAIEQLCAAQGLDLRQPLKPGLGVRAAHESVRREIPFATEDRLFGDDIQASLALLRSQSVLDAVKAAIGELA